MLCVLCSVRVTDRLSQRPGGRHDGKKEPIRNGGSTKWRLMRPAESRAGFVAFAFKLLLFPQVVCASCERDGRWGKGASNRYYALLSELNWRGPMQDAVCKNCNIFLFQLRNGKRRLESKTPIQFSFSRLFNRCLRKIMYALYFVYMFD